jgi:hypothetical protein
VPGPARRGIQLRLLPGRRFFDFAGIDSNTFKSFVAEGATDAEVADWIGQRSKVSDRTPVVVWNNKLRNTRLCDMPAERQIFLEDRSEKPARVCLVRCLRSGGKADLSSGNKTASLLV